MQDERNTPREDEVEAHHKMPDPSVESGKVEHDEDDEVEAHMRGHHGPVEHRGWSPSE
ncbi:MAG TPA: hypothetical protein VKR21_04975 [Solirubrobacteraceae bacterium]|nr:hypothetical protein [Solirubrobacteraceae bacterium]